MLATADSEGLKIINGEDWDLFVQPNHDVSALRSQPATSFIDRVTASEYKIGLNSMTIGCQTTT